MAPSRSEGRKSFVSMNLSGGDWPISMMLARSLPTRSCFIPARRLASELSYQTRTRDLEKRVLRTGFRAPRRNHQVQSWHLLRPQRRRIEPEMADNEIQ